MKIKWTGIGGKDSAFHACSWLAAHMAALYHTFFIFVTFQVKHDGFSARLANVSPKFLQRYLEVLRNGLLRCILYTCLNLWIASFGTYFTHVQTCLFKVLRNGLFRYILHMSKPVTTPVLKVLRNGRLWHNFTHVQTCHNVRLQKVLRNGLGTYFTHVQARDKFRVQSARQWTASVHTILHMAKPVITSLFKVLLNRLLRCIVYTCPNRTCDNARVQSATQWTAWVHTFQNCNNVSIKSATQ